MELLRRWGLSSGGVAFDSDNPEPFLVFFSTSFSAAMKCPANLTHLWIKNEMPYLNWKKKRMRCLVFLTVMDWNLLKSWAKMNPSCLPLLCQGFCYNSDNRNKHIRIGKRAVYTGFNLPRISASTEVLEAGKERLLQYFLRTPLA